MGPSVSVLWWPSVVGLCHTVTSCGEEPASNSETESLRMVLGLVALGIPKGCCVSQKHPSAGSVGVGTGHLKPVRSMQGELEVVPHAERVPNVLGRWAAGLGRGHLPMLFLGRGHILTLGHAQSMQCTRGPSLVVHCDPGCACLRNVPSPQINALGQSLSG